MTTALPARTTPLAVPSVETRRLHLVGEAGRDGSGGPAAPRLVSYLVVVPEGTDLRDLFAEDGPRPEIRPLAATVAAAAPRTGEGAVHIDPARQVAEVDGRQLDLTYLEFALLAHLVQHPHHVHTRERLVAAVWGYDHVGDGRTVDVHIARLRRKLGTAHRHTIVTVRRVGYKYVPDQQQSPGTTPCHRP
ncbi:winged helix-turn-helix domain-containing protein [Streptomyces sp. NPDC055952]|uniref:winged helix-turn-helix domain-containing protein n=1 Tax=Streptomyces sp. NPDC055952 TaxID=3345663 RepID=UPI0035DB3F51